MAFYSRAGKTSLGGKVTLYVLLLGMEGKVVVMASVSVTKSVSPAPASKFEDIIPPLPPPPPLPGDNGMPSPAVRLVVISPRSICPCWSWCLVREPLWDGGQTG